MRIVMFYHSLASCWNNGNAHFLRGIVSELLSRGHEVVIFEPENGWSKSNLLKDHGCQPLIAFQRSFPDLRSTPYTPPAPKLDEMLQGADLVIVHEWNEVQLVRAVAEHRRHSNYKLLFHDTHHRALTASEALTRLKLEYFDGVLAFGKTIRDKYLHFGCVNRAWTWHEAADTRIFRPIRGFKKEGDLRVASYSRRNLRKTSIRP